MENKIVLDIIKTALKLLKTDADKVDDVVEILEQAVVYISLAGVVVELAANIQKALESDDLAPAERTELLNANGKIIDAIRHKTASGMAI